MVRVLYVNDYSISARALTDVISAFKKILERLTLKVVFKFTRSMGI